MKTITFAIAIILATLSCTTPVPKQTDVVRPLELEALQSFSSLPPPIEIEVDAAKFGHCGKFPRLGVKTLQGFCVSLFSKGIERPRGISYYHHNGNEHLFVISGPQDQVTHLTYGSNFELKNVQSYLEGKFQAMDNILMGPDQLLYIGTKDKIIRFDPFVNDPEASLEIVVKDLPDKTSNEIRQFVFDEEGHLFLTTDNNTKVRKYPRFENGYMEEYIVYFEHSSPLTLNYDDENGIMMLPLFGAHASMFYRAYMFPEEFNNSLFLLPSQGQKILSLIRENDSFDRENTREIIKSEAIVPNRPYALITGPHGELLVTDYNANAIIRISYHPNVKSINHLVDEKKSKTCLIRTMPETLCQDCQRSLFLKDACSIDQAKRYYLALKKNNRPDAYKEGLEIKKFIEQGESLNKNLRLVNTKSKLNIRTGPSGQVCAQINPESQVLVAAEFDKFVEIRPFYKEDINNDKCAGKYFVHKDYLK